MSTTTRSIPEVVSEAHGGFLSARRGALALTLSIGIGLLSLLAVTTALALNSTQVFHANAEQIDQGVDVSGSYVDTYAADDAARTLKEEYVGGQARTGGDDPSDFTNSHIITSYINFTPFTTPSEGGTIYRVGMYVDQAGDTQLRLALYEDVDNLPRLLLAESEPLSATSTGWLWFDLEPVFVPAGGRYWIAHQASNGDAKLKWDPNVPSSEGYRYKSYSWGPFPTLAGLTWGQVNNRTCFQVAYTETQYALDVGYTVPVTPAMDAYTLTVQGTTSGESFSVTVDGQAAGLISHIPITRYVFSDDMESGVGGWTASGFTLVVTDSAHTSSPTHAWWTDDVPYGSSTSLTSPPITLPVDARDMEMRFWHRMVAEQDWDGGWLEYRVGNEDGSWPTWSLVTNTMIIRNSYDVVLEHIPSAPHVAWNPSTGHPITGVVRIQIPITAAGRAIQWRWVFECDTIGAEAPETPNGWWIDDVRVLGPGSDETDLIFSMSPSLASDGQVTVRFQDTITNSYADFLGIDLVEVTGLLYNRSPTVTVTTPNGGEYWSGTQTVEWSGSDVNRDVITYNVYLSTDGGGTWSSSLYQVSYDETESPAAHSWSGLDTTAFGDSDNCLVRVQASDGDASASDESDAAFTIDNTDPSVTLTAPNGGQILQGGASYTITWSASDDNFGPLPIALYYSTDGGSSFPFTITETTENDGSYVWTIPGLDNAGVKVRAVATDLLGHTSQDESDVVFTIDSTSPDGTVTVSEGDYTASQEIHLALSAPADTAEVYVDGDVADASNVRQWVAYAATVTVTLTSGEGSKTVTVRFRDVAENEGDLASDAIMYDATSPTISDQTPTDGITVTTATPVISATLADVMSGIDSASITMTVDGALVTHVYDGASGVVSYTPSSALADAAHTVTVWVQDRAGNDAYETWGFIVDVSSSDPLPFKIYLPMMVAPDTTTRSRWVGGVHRRGVVF